MINGIPMLFHRFNHLFDSSYYVEDVLLNLSQDKSWIIDHLVNEQSTSLEVDDKNIDISFRIREEIQVDSEFR